MKQDWFNEAASFGLPVATVATAVYLGFAVLKQESFRVQSAKRGGQVFRGRPPLR